MTKGWKFEKRKWEKNHPDVGSIYLNLAKLYFDTQRYSMAMKNVQQAIEIGEKKLPTNHSHLVECRETFDKIRKM